MNDRSALKAFRSLLFGLNRKVFGYNRVLDKEVRSLEEEALGKVLEHGVLDLDSDQFHRWLTHAQLAQKDKNFRGKKALEFFFSASILDPGSGDCFLDAAGGRSRYVDAIGNIYGCHRLYLQDQIYQGMRVEEKGITTIGGDASSIPLPDRSITRLSCHHAFEHFQGDVDKRFVEEIGRLLDTGGKACLIPLFLAKEYVECWNIPWEGLFDEKARLLVDPTASLPGGDEDGHFCRIYDLWALQERIVRTAQENGLEVRTVTCRVDGRDVPDVRNTLGSSLNRPLRALVLEKRKV